MSKQTQTWSSFTETERERARNFDFTPLPAAKVEHELNVGAAGLLALRKSLPEDPAKVLELWYEDLYREDLALPERLVRLGRVRAFLAGREESDSEENADTAPLAAAELLDPERWRLNSADTYRLLPNVNQLEHLFGSDAFGWLLDEHNAGHRTNWRNSWDTRSETST